MMYGKHWVLSWTQERVQTVKKELSITSFDKKRRQNEGHTRMVCRKYVPGSNESKSNGCSIGTESSQNEFSSTVDSR